MFGDAAGRAAEAAALAALDEWLVKGALAEPALAAQDQAGGMVRARPWGPGRRVTVFALLGHPVASVAGVIAVVRVRWSWRAMYRLRQRRISLGFLPAAVRRAT